MERKDLSHANFFSKIRRRCHVEYIVRSTCPGCAKYDTHVLPQFGKRPVYRLYVLGRNDPAVFGRSDRFGAFWFCFNNPYGIHFATLHPLFGDKQTNTQTQALLFYYYY